MVSKATLLVLVLAVAGCTSTQPAYDSDMPVLPVEERIDNATALLQSGQFERAEVLFRGVIEESPGQADALVGLASVRLQQGRTVQAGELLAQALALDPTHLDALEGSARVALAERRVVDAQAGFESVLARDTGRWRSWDGLGVVADLTGRHQDAASFYQRALQEGGSERVVLNNLGYSHMMAGELASAEQVLARAVNRYPESDRVRANLALVQARSGQYEVARRTWGGFLNDAEACNNVGYVAMMRGDLAQAEAYFEKALALSPRYYPAADANLSRVRSLKQAQQQP